MVDRDGKSTNNSKIYLGPAQQGGKRKWSFARNSVLASRWGKEKVSVFLYLTSTSIPCSLGGGPFFSPCTE